MSFPFSSMTRLWTVEAAYPRAAAIKRVRQGQQRGEILASISTALVQLHSRY
jgi:hypothetical protein